MKYYSRRGMGYKGIWYSISITLYCTRRYTYVILTYLYAQNGGLTWTLKVTLLQLTFVIRLFF